MHSASKHPGGLATVTDLTIDGDLTHIMRELIYQGQQQGRLEVYTSKSMIFLIVSQNDVVEIKPKAYKKSLLVFFRCPKK